MSETLIKGSQNIAIIGRDSYFDKQFNDTNLPAADPTSAADRMSKKYLLPSTNRMTAIHQIVEQSDEHSDAHSKKLQNSMLFDNHGYSEESERDDDEEFKKRQ